MNICACVSVCSRDNLTNVFDISLFLIHIFLFLIDIISCLKRCFDVYNNLKFHFRHVSY